MALRPKTTPPGSVPSRSPSAARQSCTTCSARRAAAVTVPRFEIDDPRVDATACATSRGTCEPPGPSKCAVPSASAGKLDRTFSTSYAHATEHALGRGRQPVQTPVSHAVASTSVYGARSMPADATHSSES